MNNTFEVLKESAGDALQDPRAARHDLERSARQTATRICRNGYRRKSSPRVGPAPGHFDARGDWIVDHPRVEARVLKRRRVLLVLRMELISLRRHAEPRPPVDERRGRVVVLEAHLEAGLQRAALLSHPLAVVELRGAEAAGLQRKDDVALERATKRLMRIPLAVGHRRYYFVAASSLI